MKILIVTPAPPGSRKGNRVTALRWARLLRQLGHQVSIRQAYRHEHGDVLVALHARRSFSSIRRFKKTHPKNPIAVALTGTDLYEDIRRSAIARQSLRIADRLIVLQPLGVEALPADVRHKARVVYQSVNSSFPRSAWERTPGRSASRLHRDTERRGGVPTRSVGTRFRHFDVCVLGHLRPVKDPFRTALAVRKLPAESRIRVLHVGAALSPGMARRARAEMRLNPRYRWLGELPRGKALRVLSRCRLLVLTSKLEGGANVISEAVVHDVPVVSSRIDGSVGLLGPDYPGYFPVGDTPALTEMLQRVETDAAFYYDLRSRCRKLRPLFTPERERQALGKLMEELRVT